MKATRQNMKSLVLVLLTVTVLVLTIMSVSQATSDTNTDSENVSYAGYQVLKVNTKTKAQVLALRTFTRENQLDVWSIPRMTFPTDILVPPQKMDAVKAFFKAQNLREKIMIPDLQKAITEEAINNNINTNTVKKDTEGMSWSKWYKYDEITAWMEKVHTKNPSLTTLTPIGTRKTLNGRDILLMSITTSKKSDAVPQVLIVAGMHGREWISTATATYIIGELTRNIDYYKVLLERFVIHILPVANPDGYVYSHETNRNWRKNLVPSSSLNNCFGTDLDRNFPYQYNTEGANSDKTCDGDFNGFFRSSEVETEAIIKFVEENKKISQYYSLHAYGQHWMYPYSYKDVEAEHEEKLARISKLATDAIKKVRGTQYKFGRMANIFGNSPGTDIDWAYHDRKIQCSYHVELGDNGTAGFLLPLNEIRPTAHEVWIGIQTAIIGISTEKEEERDGGSGTTSAHLILLSIIGLLIILLIIIIIVYCFFCIRKRRDRGHLILEN